MATKILEDQNRSGDTFHKKDMKEKGATYFLRSLVAFVGQIVSSTITSSDTSEEPLSSQTSLATLTTSVSSCQQNNTRNSDNLTEFLSTE